MRRPSTLLPLFTDSKIKTNLKKILEPNKRNDRLYPIDRNNRPLVIDYLIWILTLISYLATVNSSLLYKGSNLLSGIANTVLDMEVWAAGWVKLSESFSKKYQIVKISIIHYYSKHVMNYDTCSTYFPKSLLVDRYWLSNFNMVIRSSDFLVFLVFSASDYDFLDDHFASKKLMFFSTTTKTASSIDCNICDFLIYLFTISHSPYQSIKHLKLCIFHYLHFYASVEQFILSKSSTKRTRKITCKNIIKIYLLWVEHITGHFYWTTPRVYVTL